MKRVLFQLFIKTSLHSTCVGWTSLHSICVGWIPLESPVFVGCGRSCGRPAGCFVGSHSVQRAQNKKTDKEVNKQQPVAILAQGHWCRARKKTDISFLSASSPFTHGPLGRLPGHRPHLSPCCTFGDPGAAPRPPHRGVGAPRTVLQGTGVHASRA